MKVRELKDVLADAEDEAEVIVTKIRTIAAGAVSGFGGSDVFEVIGASKQDHSGKVCITFDESKRTDY